MALSTTPTGFDVGAQLPILHLASNRNSEYESMHAVYSRSGITLVVRFTPCGPADIQSIEGGWLKFGLSKMNGGYCWLLRTDVVDLDAPYSPCIQPIDNQALPWSGADRGVGERLRVSLAIVDGSGICRALKLVSVSPSFAKKLAELHAATLAGGPITRSEWDQVVSQVVV